MSLAVTVNSPLPQTSISESVLNGTGATGTSTGVPSINNLTIRVSNENTVWPLNVSGTPSSWVAKTTVIV
jgi:hypothetical protein